MAYAGIIWWEERSQQQPHCLLMETREKNHWWEVATMASSSISSPTSRMTRPAVLTVLFSSCFSPFTTFPITHYAPSFLFFQLRDISTYPRRKGASLLLLLLLLKFFGSKKTKGLSFWPPSSVDWFHLQKLIPSGPLYHDCISKSTKLCFLFP